MIGERHRSMRVTVRSSAKHRLKHRDSPYRCHMLIGISMFDNSEGRINSRLGAQFGQHRWGNVAAGSIALVVLCTVLMTWLLRLGSADLSVPFGDRGDNLLNSVLVKSLIDNGWVWHNPYLGAPYGTQLLDFPFYDNLNLLLMKLIGTFTASYAKVVNLFFLLTFPLTTLSSFLVLRSFKISYSSAMVVSLLYTFLPYHFQRGEAHLFLSAYFLIPPMTMVVLWVWTGNQRRNGPEPGSFSLSRKQMVVAAVVCVLVGSANSYYTFFGCYLLCLAAAVSAIRFKSWVRLAWGFALAGLTLTVLVINTSPTWLYGMRHGYNSEVAIRIPAESETYGLKMTHLLLPISVHRVDFLRDIRQRYDRSATGGEGATASMGMAGDVGFIFLLGWLLCSPQGQTHRELLNALAVLTFSALLFGTMGGLGAIFNYLINSQFRAYNRISIYIAFFSLFGVAVLLDTGRRWAGNSSVGTYLWFGLSGVILCLGLLDQTSPSFVPDYAGLNKRFEKEQEFITRIEASVPRGAMIFELPNESFPESQPLGTMQAYEELTGYLHSRFLRWSAGAMRGRPEARWPARHGLNVGAEAGPSGQHRIALQLPPQALDALTFAGFSGVYVDRNGFWDFGASIILQLQALLGEAPLEDANRRYAFFDLSAYTAALRAKYKPEQWEAERHKVLELPSLEQSTR